ncbi:MAG TPA: hotdog domain-containing protein [Thermoanaerobaculia bacterium]|jgi:uncharacterized protein (TIGR00369 family)
MTPRTHREIDPRLSGRPIELGEGRARCEMVTTREMRADEHGLVHGGFVFSLADHAAMLAVNHPNVVLGSAETRFLKPVAVGETLVASAELARQEGKKQIVRVHVTRGDDVVFEGELTCFSPARHVLDGSR